MRARLICTSLVHLFAISLFLIPVKFKGPVVTAIFGFRFRALEAVSLTLMIAGTVFMFGSLFIALRIHLKRMKQLPSNDAIEKTE